MRDTTAVLLIAHGSRRSEANDELSDLAVRLRGQDESSIVVASFLELAEPDIATGGAQCVERGATRVLLVPYFLSMGVHLTRDLTAARSDLAARFPQVQFELGPPLGPDPDLDLLVRKRIEQTRQSADRESNAGKLGSVSHGGQP